MGTFNIKVINTRYFEGNEYSELMSQTFTDHLNDTFISSAEVTILLMVCMGFVQCKGVSEVSFYRLGNGGYGVKIEYTDKNLSDIVLAPYAEIGTSMMNDIMSALIASGMLHYLPVSPMEGENNE